MLAGKLLVCASEGPLGTTDLQGAFIFLGGCRLGRSLASIPHYEIKQCLCLH